MINFCLDRYKFQFIDRVRVFVLDDNFDEKYRYGHGATMLKKVDILVEDDSKNYDIFVELKGFSDISIDQKIKLGCDTRGCTFKGIGCGWPKCKLKFDRDSELKNDLISKFRDTYIYRKAEGTGSKPILYVALVNLESPSLSNLDDIRYELPVGTPNGYPNEKWNQSLAEELLILDVNLWNENSILSLISKVEPLW